MESCNITRERYLFIVRSPSGIEIFAKELDVFQNVFYLAQSLMDIVREEKRDVFPERCEVWFKTDPNNMKLLVTVY